MSFLRSLLFSVALWVWTITLGILFLPLWLLPKRLTATSVPRLWTGGVLAFLRIFCGITHRIEGSEHIPAGATIFALKHQSAWETFALWHLLPAPVFVLKKELLKIPVFGQYLARTPIIAIDRSAGKKALVELVRQAEEHVQEGRQIMIFPEGTRSLPGSQNAYKPGVAVIYEKTGLPVIPVALNSGLFWAKKQFIKRPGTITVRFLPPIAPGMDRETFMRTLEEQIESHSRALADPDFHLQDAA